MLSTEHFRDHLIAAPLKQELLSSPESWTQYFRDHLIAAPLKHRAGGAANFIEDHFRDHLIAAPLKQPGVKRRLAGAAISAII